MLEAQFETANITSDKTKFTAVVANLGDEYLDQVEVRVLDPSATGRYEKLKMNSPKEWPIWTAQESGDCLKIKKWETGHRPSSAKI